MKYFLPVLLVFLFVPKAEPEIKIGKGPSVHTFTHIPYDFREKNYKNGSCVHASAIMSMRYMSMYAQADFWRKNYAYGEYATRLSNRMKREGIPNVLHTRGSLEFLEDCSRTRRPAVIGYGTRHSQLFCGFQNGEALILNNNDIDNPYTVPIDKFLRVWRANNGGWAVVPLGPYTVSPRIWK